MGSLDDFFEEYRATLARSDVGAPAARQLRREDGSAIYDFTAVYTPARVDGAWKVAGIVHDELPELQAALASA